MAFVTYTDNGTNTPDGTHKDFTYTFPIISTDGSDVKVALNGVVQATTKYAVSTSPAKITFNSNSVDTNVQAADGAPLTGVTVRVFRDTQLEDADTVTFVAGSSIRAQDLNANFTQTRYALQEEQTIPLNNEDISDGAITSAKIQDLTIVAADIADATITGAKLVNDTVTATQIAADAIGASELADNSVASANIIDGTIVNADINANLGLELTKLEDVNSAKIIVGNGSNKAAQVDMSGDVTIDNAGATTIAADAVQFANISDTQVTSAFNAASDDKIPTSKAVADHVVDVVNSIGGFVVVPDKDNFPASHPDPNNDAGTVLSITNPNGLTVSSNTSSNGTRTGGSSTVTINNIPSDAGSTLTANYTMLVQTTSTEHTYDFYKFLAKDGDVLSLSNDINDFAARYRVAASAPVTGLCDANGENTGSYPCDGDMYFNSSDNKMYVFGAPASSTSTSDLQAAWAQVTSTGEFKSLTVKTNGQPHNGTLTFDGTATQFDLFDGNSAASIVNRNQLIVVLNGVVQKSNAGVYSSSEEGFYLDGTDGIRFCTPPPTDADPKIFVTLIGSAVSVPTPGNESVTEAKLNTNAPTNDYVLTADDTATGGFKWAENVPIGGDNGVSFNDNVEVSFGTGSDNNMVIAHTPHQNKIEAADGGIFISADDIQLLSHDTAGRALYLDGSNDRLELGYDGNHSVHITSTGVTFLKTQSSNDDIHTYWGDDSDLSINYDGTANLGQIEINNVPLQILTGTGRDVEFWHDDSGDNNAQFAHIKDTDIWCKGHFVTGDQGEVRLNDANSSNYVGFKSPATVASNKVWTLPAADGSANQALTTDGAGALAWSDVSSTVANDAIYINDDEITADYTVAAGKGAHSVGPITLTGCTVTVYGRWVIS